MSICASLIRLLRRRFILGLIFTLSLTYCVYSLLRNEKTSLRVNSNLDDINLDNEELISDDDMLSEQSRLSGKPPMWQMEIVEQAINDNAANAFNLNESDASAQPCRNSVQGKALIVDERGIVCARHEVLSNGCCRLEQKQGERYSCRTCNPQGCCTTYEYCVSCCLYPSKQIKGRRDVMSGSVRTQRGEDAVRKRVRNLDRFQICLAVCRTSSASVRHENTYKDPLAKHCYAMQPSNSHQRRQRDIGDSLNNNGDSAVVVTSSSVVMLLTRYLSKFRSLYRLLAASSSHALFCTSFTLKLCNYRLCERSTFKYIPISRMLIRTLIFNIESLKGTLVRSNPTHNSGLQTPYICV